MISKLLPFLSGKERIWVLRTSTLILFGVVFYAGFYFGEKNIPDIDKISITNKEEGKPEQVDFSPFWKSWNIINEKYVSLEDTNDQKKVWGAIEGLASSLDDPYTVFMPPAEAEIFQGDIKGSFGGVGMEIGTRDNILTVISPLKGTPAERAGILPQDKIVEINGTSTAKMSADEAVKLIRGEEGTEVKFTLIREGISDPIKIAVIRDIINIPTLDTEIKGDVFIIKLYSFSANSPDLFRESLRKFVLSGKNKLILDLRGNPGGYMNASVDMASWFLPVGKIVVRESFGKNKDEIIHRSIGYNIFNNNLKMVILVNGGSASASEILAGALREHGVAKLVGEKTFGKGSVQELVSVTDNTSLKITVAKWLTPNGHSLSKNGLDPDIEVKMTSDDIKAEKDPQIAKAIELLNQ